MRFEKMPAPGTLTAGQTATIQLPKGPTYHSLHIEMNVDGTPRDVPIASWGDYIDDIRVIVNGDIRIVWKASDLVKHLQFFDQVLTPGVLPVLLSQPWARTMGGEDGTAYGTASGVSSFTLEIDLKAGITVNRLEVWAAQTDPQPFGAHMTVQRFSGQSGLVGVKEISDLPRGGYRMFGMHITTAAIDKVEILANNVKVNETTKLLRTSNMNLRGRNPQADMTHIDFIERNRLDDAMPMALQDFRLKLDITAANQNYDIYAVSIQGA